MINDINYCNYLVAKMVVSKFGLASSVGLVTTTIRNPCRVV